MGRVQPLPRRRPEYLPQPDGRAVLRNALRQCRSAMAAVASFSFAINLLMLAPALFMLQVYDRVLSTGRHETLILLTLIAAVALILLGVLDALRGIIGARVGAWLHERIAPLAVEAGVDGGLRGDPTGANAVRDVSTVQSFVSSPQAAFFFDAPWVPIYVAIIALLHPMLGLIALVAAIILAMLAALNELITRGPMKAYAAAQAAAAQECAAAVRNAEAVRAMGMMPAVVARWTQANGAAQHRLTAAAQRSAVLLGFTKSFRTMVQIAILAAGAWYVLAADLSAGAMIAASILLGRALAPVEQAITAWRSFVGARMAMDRLRTRIEETPSAARSRVRLPAPNGPLALSNVTVLSPRDKTPILRDVSFTLSPGEAMAVIGPSASGKSTLCRVLTGLLKPNFGSARLSGSEITHWDSEQLGEHLGYLPQDASLFAGTVFDNIARLRSLPDRTVIDAAVTAEAHDLISSLPDGYQTAIGEGGAGLSGGQRQRIGLARALCGEPALVVLDEPNANLDQAGETALSAAIMTLKSRGSILVIVGHRPSTIAAVDKILVLSRGHVEMLGTREEVLERMRRNASTPRREQVPERAQPARSPARAPATMGAASPHT